MATEPTVSTVSTEKNERSVAMPEASVRPKPCGEGAVAIAAGQLTREVPSPTPLKGLLGFAMRTAAFNCFHDLTLTKSDHEHDYTAEGETWHEQEVRDGNEHGGQRHAPRRPQTLECANHAVVTRETRNTGVARTGTLAVSRQDEMLLAGIYFRSSPFPSGCQLSALLPPSPTEMARPSGSRYCATRTPNTSVGF